MADLGRATELLGSREGLARFIADPKAFVREAGLSENDTAQIRRLEAFNLGLINNLSAAADSAGFKAAAADWGIGAGCCNKKTLFAGVSPRA